MEFLYSFIDIFGVVVCFACCMIVSAHKPSYGQKYLLMTNVCALIIAMGDLLEFYARSQEAALVATKVAYIGKNYIMLFALLFVTGFTRVGMNKKIAWGMAFYNTVLMFMVTTCERHTLFYSSIRYTILPGGRGMLVLGKGIFFYAWAAEMGISIFWYCWIALKAGVMKGSREAKLRGMLVFLAVVVPLGLLIAYVAGGFTQFDPMTLAITDMAICFLIAVQKFGLLDTMQLAQERVLEDTKDGLIIVDDRQSRVIYANPVAASLMPELMESKNKKAIERIFHAQENVFDKDGRHYEIRISKVMGDMHRAHEVQGYIAWIFDMTFINQYTSEMIRLKEASEQANLAKTNFLAHMSHEIRTPMNAIVGYSNMALHSDDEALIHRYLKNIKQASGTLLHLINEVLDISKIESGKMELVNVNYRFDKVIQELRSMMEPQTGKAGLALIIETDRNIPPCLFGDRVKFQEILTNLISNSIKYTRAGSVTLRIRRKEQTQQHVMLHIEVEDTGIGIEEKNYSLVFGKFEQFDRKNNYQIEGSGLGLSIVKSFVEMMEGHISFESEYGKGTKFIIEIWQGIGEEKPDSGTEEVTFDESAEINSGEILVVDDNELNCDVAQGILNSLGMITETVRSAKDCITLLEEGRHYDLIFMDHMMPDMDGVEALHLIRKMDKDVSKTPVVLLTANAVSGVKEEMIQEGFDAFLSKPIDINELRKVLIRFIGVYKRED